LVPWNYRVASRPTDPVPSYGIYEVYYDQDGDILWYSPKPMAPYGDIEDEIYEDINRMLGAFQYDILNLNQVDREIKLKSAWLEKKDKLDRKRNRKENK
jgi:hypothetical protein